MAIPNKNITAGESVVVDSNPSDPNNNPTIPTGDIMWAQDSNAFGTGAPQGTLDEQYKFSSPAGGPLGVTTITMAGPGNTTNSQVTVTVVSGNLDHFAPTFEAPTTP